MPRSSKLIVSRMCSLKGCGYNNSSPSLLHLPGVWVSSLLQWASQGRKLVRIQVHQWCPCLSKVHWPVWKAALPWFWCWCGLFTPVCITGAELEHSPEPSCSWCCACSTRSTSLLAVGSAHIPRNHPTAPETGTLWHREEIKTRNVELFYHPASNCCWINAVY